MSLSAHSDFEFVAKRMKKGERACNGFHMQVVEDYCLIKWNRLFFQWTRHVSNSFCHAWIDAHERSITIGFVFNVFFSFFCVWVFMWMRQSGDRAIANRTRFDLTYSIFLEHLVERVCVRVSNLWESVCTPKLKPKSKHFLRKAKWIQIFVTVSHHTLIPDIVEHWWCCRRHTEYRNIVAICRRQYIRIVLAFFSCVCVENSLISSENVSACARSDVKLKAFSQHARASKLVIYSSTNALYIFLA